MKRLFVLLASLLLVFGICAHAAYFVDISDESVVLQINSTKALVRGTEMTLDVAPMIVDGRTLLPVRFVAEYAAGGNVTWDDAEKIVEITTATAEVTIKIGAADMYVNGKTVALDVHAKIINGRTMLPVRAVVEAVGKEVYWDEANKIVMVNDYPFPDMTEEIKITVAKLNGTYVAPEPEEEPEEEESTGVPADANKVYTLLYEEAFKGGKIEAPGTQQQGELAKVEPGMLNMNMVSGGWSSFYPRKNWNYLRYTEFKCTIEASSTREVPAGYSALFVGARATNYEGIPTDKGTFWVAFNDTDKAYIFAGDHIQPDGTWTGYNCEVPLKAGITEKSMIQVVDTMNEITYYLDGEIVCRVVINNDDLKIYDVTGSLVATAENTLKSKVAFKTFSHLASSKLYSMKIEGVEKPAGER